MDAAVRCAHVLLIDDQLDILTLFQRLLEGEGYCVTALRDPVDPAQVRALAPDVIVMEFLALGGTQSGGKYLAALRSAPGLAGIPLLLCTSADLRVEHPLLAARLELMGVRMMVKPCKLTHLVAAVGEALGNHTAAEYPHAM